MSRTDAELAADLAGNPVANVRAPKAPRGLPKALSVEQTQALLDRAPARVATEPAALRDQAMFELLYSSGLRLSELVGRELAPEDLVVMKAISHDEESPRHWHDALGVLATVDLDWDYLLERAPAWGVER